MDTNSDFKLTNEEMKQLEDSMSKLWTYLHDIVEKNENRVIPDSEIFQLFICNEKILKWLKSGANFQE
jgi:hypothetical protein